ncbi:VWFA domain-containing protein [Pleurotus pulmonarius]
MNFTIDDTYGDPTTNRNITYFPEGAWRDGEKCGNCTAHLEASNVYNRSWTESLFVPLPDCGDTTVIPSASVVFNGTAVYVLCAIAQFGWSHRTDSNMTFLIDGKVAGTFSRPSLGPAGYEYNVTVFSKTNLLPGEHNLTIQNGHINGTRSLILLDAILYTQDIGEPIAGPPGLTPPNIIPPSTTPPSKTPTIVGGILGGVGALLLLAITILMWRCYRRRHLVAGPRVSRDKTSWQRDIPITTMGHNLLQASSPRIPFLRTSSHHFTAHSAADPTVAVSPLGPSRLRHSRSNSWPGILIMSTNSSNNETPPNDTGPIPKRHASVSSPQPIATTQPLNYAKKLPRITPATSSSPNHVAEIHVWPSTSSLVTQDRLETFLPLAAAWPRFTHSRLHISRVVFSEHFQTNSFACLPLIDAQVTAMALDVSSRVTITQVYLNEASSGTGPAKFMFSVPQNATICAFEARKSNGEVTTWKSRASEDGPHQYEIEGQDTFIMPVGSIPSNGTIEVKLNYVASLFSENNANLDDIRLIIPAHAGEPSGPRRHSTQAEGNTILRIRVDIQTAGYLLQVISPSHRIEKRDQLYTASDQNDTFRRRRTKIVYESTNFLSKDFVLSIQAEGLDGPRCFAEPLVRDEHSHHGLDTVAFCLTVVPKSVIPRLPLQEYLFVIDRSTSMRGSRIEIAKETLCKLLRSLPSEGTKFNVLSFAQHVDQHRPQSVVFKPPTLSNAITYVRGLTTDQNGTNIRGALQAAFRRSDRAMPTSIFLLTDGEAKVMDREGTLEDVRVAVQAASTSAPIRVFTLGIGVTVAKDLCMAMAKTGNGVCLLAPHADGIWSQCTRLFHAGGAPFITGVAIDWGIPLENLQSKSPVHSMAIRQDAAASALQQSPSLISDLHAGSRFCVYAIASVKEISVPQVVTISGQIGDHGEHFEVVAPVHISGLEDTDPGTPLIHTLAARELIREYDEQLTHNKVTITQLGEAYNIETQHTSFVAIANENMINDGAEPLRCSRSSGGSYETADTAFSDTRSPWFGLVELPGGA